MRELAHEELKSLQARRDTLLAELKVLLVPKDPNDSKNVVLEIRAGAGGDEAALFASDLFRMYSRYAERQGWRLEVLNLSDTGVGGTKEVTAPHRRQGRLRPVEVRERRAPRAARAGDRGERAHPHVDGDGGRAAGSRGSGRPDRRQGSAHRHVLLERPRRPERQHDLLGRPDHPPPDRTRRLAAGREVAGQEPREGHESPPLAAVRHRDAAAAGGHREGSAHAGRNRATAPRRFAPTTSRRTASPTTGSATACISSPMRSTATSTSSSIRPSLIISQRHSIENADC